VEDALAIALGEMKMSFDSFCALTVEEFDRVLKRWSEDRDSDYKDKWERARLIATVPHLKDKSAIIKMLTFPWDKSKNTTIKVRDPERFERLKKEYGETL
jgi:uncharacterized phage-like protein YoqJ